VQLIELRASADGDSTPVYSTEYTLLVTRSAHFFNICGLALSRENDRQDLTIPSLTNKRSNTDKPSAKNVTDEHAFLLSDINRQRNAPSRRVTFALNKEPVRCPRTSPAMAS